MKRNTRKGSKKRPLLQDLRILKRGLKLWFSISPRFFIYRILVMVVEALSPYFTLYLSAMLVNELAGQCDPQRLAALAAVTVLGGFIISTAKHIVNQKANLWLENAFQQVELFMFDCQNRLQYEHLENNEITLLRERIFAAAAATGGGLWRLVWDIPSLAGHLSNLAASAALTISIFRMTADTGLTGFLAFVNSPGSAVTLILLLVLDIFLSARIKAVSTRKEKEVVAALAEDNTLHHVLTRVYGEDVAIFNLKETVLQEWENKLLKPKWEAEAAGIRIKYGTMATLVKAVLNAAVFLFTAVKAYIGVFGIGSYILYRGTVSRFVSAVSDITEMLVALQVNNDYLEELYRFLDLPDNMYKGTLAVEKRNDIDYEIEFRNVSFKYPGTDTWALKDVNMKFRIGDKLAIVGENGSGKTTFIKLLCRLYDPTEGTILLNGIDITKYRYNEYIELFSVVFQDYQLFQFSLAANVAGSFDYAPERVEECLNQAGFGDRLQDLEKGIETVLGRDYENDGIDLSGGEQQRIALARALYKDAPFVVLDEPTAALDPKAEAAVYESFQELTRGKTAVFISHRLSSCRFCDDIIVFEKGRLVQRGNHDRLSEEGGKYRQLWDAQAKYYTEPALS